MGSTTLTNKSSALAGRHGDTTALVIRDRCSGWAMGSPSKGKTTDGIERAVIQLNGADKVKLWHSDGVPELHAACRELCIRHDTADPHRSETHGANERPRRIVIEGARTCLHQGRLPYKCWELAIECFHGGSEKGTHTAMWKGTYVSSLGGSSHLARR